MLYLNIRIETELKKKKKKTERTYNQKSSHSYIKIIEITMIF